MIEEVSKVFRTTELRELFGLNRGTIARWEREGSFPRRVKLGVKLYGWQEKDILDWLHKHNNAA